MIFISLAHESAWPFLNISPKVPEVRGRSESIQVGQTADNFRGPNAF